MTIGSRSHPLPPYLRRCAGLIAEGRTQKDVAYELGLTLNSVKVYCEHIAMRLKLDKSKNRVSMITRWWIEHEEREK